MDTIVTIQLVQTESSADADAAIERAFGWFREIEERCTRFDERSELMKLTAQVGVPVPVSTILYEAVRFALMVAEESGGAFDPTVGRRMEGRGYNKEYRTGRPVSSVPRPDSDACYKDISLDPDQRTITLHRPLTLDLGAVAKGLAVDTAARELEPFANFAIDAGGDLYLGGSNEQGHPWSVGIRHPRQEHGLIASLRVSNQAVCTSGDYERRDPNGTQHHILDPRTGASPDAVASAAVASATVVASGAMLADALATAAFVLGPEEGLQLLNRLGVEGLIVTQDMECHETRGLYHAA
jgi:thiamine biosynthesis lipoprotein